MTIPDDCPCGCWGNEEEHERRERIASHNRGCGEHYEVDVPSEDGTRSYNVLLCTGEWHCGCKGFRFRHSCSHVAAAKLLHGNLEKTVLRRAEEALEREIDQAADLESKIKSWKLQLVRQADLTPAQKQKIETNIAAASAALGKIA